MKYSRLSVLVAILGLAAAAGHAQLLPVGDDFQVSTYDTIDGNLYYRMSPQAAVGPEGEFVVVWADYPASFQGRGFAADGTPGSEFTIARGDGYRNLAIYLAMSQESHDEVVVTWPGYAPFGAPALPAILVQRYSIAGTSVGERFTANQDLRIGNSSPVVARKPDGEFVVVWERFYGGVGIRGRRFDPAGTALGEEFVIETGSDATQPAVAVLPHGDFLVAWASSTAPGDDAGFGIVGRLYGTGGEPVTGAFKVNTTTAGQQFHPAVAAAPDGRFLVVWDSETSSGSDSSLASIQGQLFRFEGTALGGELQINTYTTGRQHAPAAAAGPGGEFVVTWTSRGSGGSDDDSYSVQARLLDADGAPLGEDVQVNTVTSGSQRDPAVSVGRQGKGLIVWDLRPDDPLILESSVRGRRFELPVPLLPAECADPRFLCLGGGGRFEIKVEWVDFSGNAGSGRRVGGPAGTSDSGLFYFFDADNWEVLIKVLDGCGFNGHYWVFAAATTNVAYTITVTDTAAGRDRVYSNPLGTAAAAITDVEAFATCD
jgi:hypothetical protein